MTTRERLHWFAMHGVVRSAAAYSAKRGDLQARLMADPSVRADPVPFYEELRAQGPLVRSRVGFLTVNHAIAHELLRSEDFRVITFGTAVAFKWDIQPDVEDTFASLFDVFVDRSAAKDVEKKNTWTIEDEEQGPNAERQKLVR